MKKLKFLLLAVYFCNYIYGMQDVCEIDFNGNIRGIYNTRTCTLNLSASASAELSSIIFDKVDNVRVINIDSSIVKICYYAFRNVKNLNTINIYLGKNMLHIETAAFRSCKVSELNFIDSLGENMTSYYKYMQNRIHVEDEGFEFEVLRRLSFDGNWFSNGWGVFNFGDPKNLHFNELYTGNSAPTIFSPKGHEPLFNCNMMDIVKLYQWKKLKFNEDYLLCEKIDGNGCLTIPDRYYDIEENTFANCRNSLKYVSISKNISSLYDGIFLNCRELSVVKIGGIIDKIPPRAFMGCNKLQDIIFAPDVVDLDHDRSQKQFVLEIPEYITSIDDQAFAGCSALREIALPENLQYIGDNVFADCHKKLVVYTKNKTIKNKLKGERIKVK